MMPAYHSHPSPFPLAPNYSRASATFPDHHYAGPLLTRPFIREHVAPVPRHYQGHRRVAMLDPEKLYSQAVHSFNDRHKAVARTGKGGPAPHRLLPAAPPCRPRGQGLRARGRGKAYAPAARAGGRERSSSPALTRRRAWPVLTRRRAWLVPPPAWHGRGHTTVMICNIPNKLS
ncbi:hypothetical protein D1007_50764 [Hordeum vulgare]|nr:hypothetical protein D1007_50764 [Hordeum vulgare]